MEINIIRGIIYQDVGNLHLQTRFKGQNSFVVTTFSPVNKTNVLAAIHFYSDS